MKHAPRPSNLYVRGLIHAKDEFQYSGSRLPFTGTADLFPPGSRCQIDRRRLSCIGDCPVSQSGRPAMYISLADCIFFIESKQRSEMNLSRMSNPWLNWDNTGASVRIGKLI